MKNEFEPNNAGEASVLPVFSARLPLAEHVASYLMVADTTRQYSNHGKLVRLLETRLAQLLGVTGDKVASASSGSAALVGAILGRAGRASAGKTMCICPAYTFIGTSAAIEQCGYRLHLADITTTEWSLDPVALESHPRLGEVGLVVVVAPYGRLPPQQRWHAFEQRTGIPVVIDAAASFETILREPERSIGSIPVALSFQATKSFSTGEGGAVVCADNERLSSIARALNFGFSAGRSSEGSGINGRMSEYAAAVGLASLDDWQQARHCFDKVIATYRNEAAAVGVSERVFLYPLIASCYVLFLAHDGFESIAVRDRLAAAKIESRLWYGEGLHRQPYLSAVDRSPLPITDELAPRIIGLPTGLDLEDEVVHRIVLELARR